MLDCFAIFEGGGAKGLAHIGALKAAEERGALFLGVAGTSAGSIVAALAAAGWSADELYDPHAAAGEKGVLEKDFLDFFDRDLWDQLVAFKADAEATFAGRSAAWAWLRAPGFYRRQRAILGQLAASRGFFHTDAFRAWIEERLREKVDGSGPHGDVLFKDISTPLKIIATDLTRQRIRLFGNSPSETPNESVAEAVAASICIPFFFVPHRFRASHGLSLLVDGGLLSNFPAWVFDEERHRAGVLMQTGVLAPTLGFTLVERGTAAESGEAISPRGLLDFATRLFTTALAGDPLLETRQVANLQTIRLTVRVGTFDFDMPSELKEDLYYDGYRGAIEFFKSYVGPVDPALMEPALKVVRGHIGECLGRDVHLRINVALPIGDDRLRILYTYNMDEDADDRLEFNEGVGATGLCWHERSVVVCDLQEAKQTFATRYHMSKYQQALVRPQLRSLLSVPIFAERQLEIDLDHSDRDLIGVLNFDSDDDLLAEFAQGKIRAAAEDCAHVVGMVLTRQ